MSVLKRTNQSSRHTDLSNKTWEQNAIIVAGGNGKGNQLNQLYSPCGIYIDDNQTIFIADFDNHRVVEWELNAQNGRVVAGGNGKGDGRNQLNHPTDIIVDKRNNSLIIADCGNRRVVEWFLENDTTYGQIIIPNINCWGLAMDKDESLYVSDYVRNEVKRWRRGEGRIGTLVAGRYGRGKELNRFDEPSFICVDKYYSIYVSDRRNNRIMKWTAGATEGMVVAGGNDDGNKLEQLSCPCGVIVDNYGQIYIADGWNDRVICWCRDDIKGRVVVGDKNDQSNQLSYPRGLSFDSKGNLYVAEWENHRIVKYEAEVNLKNRFS